MTMKNIRTSILITSSYTHADAIRRAMLDIEAIYADGGIVDNVFFYAAGVDQTNQWLEPDALAIARAWAQLSQSYQFPLLVCVTAAERRGIYDTEIANQKQLPVSNMSSLFSAVGMGEFFARLHDADRLVQY